jgi:hypothetical protein
MPGFRGNQAPPIFQDIGERVKSPAAQRVKKTRLSVDDKLVGAYILHAGLYSNGANHQAPPCFKYIIPNW